MVHSEILVLFLLTQMPYQQIRVSECGWEIFISETNDKSMTLQWVLCINI